MWFLIGLMMPAAMAAGWAMGYSATKRAVREEVERLSKQLPASGVVADKPAVPPPSPAAPAPAQGATATQEIDEETLMVIAAAVAAFLGKRAKVRQVRLISSSLWAQQGRASIQASHRLPIHHG